MREEKKSITFVIGRNKSSNVSKDYTRTTFSEVAQAHTFQNSRIWEEVN